MLLLVAFRAEPDVFDTTMAEFKDELVLALSTIAPFVLAASSVVPEAERAKTVLPVPVAERSAVFPSTVWA